MKLGHILDNNRSREELDEILKETAKVKALYQTEKGRGHLRRTLVGKRIVLLFYQPSTRTRLKFEWAARALGANVAVINEIAHTSIVKGESWENTIETIARLADLIVIRHPQNFMPHRAAQICDSRGLRTKIINAGDGNNLHPTQAFLDLFTLKELLAKSFGKKPVKIAIGADLKNARVAHSLVSVLAKYPVELFLVSWEDRKLPKDYLLPVVENQVDFIQRSKLPLSEKMDAIYWFRLQIEHLPAELKEETREKYNRDFKINLPFLRKHLKEDGIFLHPGPRDGEIDNSIDEDPRVKDKKVQVENGFFNSMALLKMMLSHK